MVSRHRPGVDPATPRDTNHADRTVASDIAVHHKDITPPTPPATPERRLVHPSPAAQHPAPGWTRPNQIRDCSSGNAVEHRHIHTGRRRDGAWRLSHHLEPRECKDWFDNNQEPEWPECRHVPTGKMKSPVIRWNSQSDNTLPNDSGRRSVRSGLLAPKPGRQRRTILKLSYRGIP